MTVEKTTWGNVHGRDVYLYTLKCGAIELKVSNYGCTVVAVLYNGANTILAYTNADDMFSDKYYTGCLVGRFAGRISAAAFEIEGGLYQLPANDGNSGNHLHGGPNGFNKICFDTSSVNTTDTETSITFNATSPHLDQGYPGNVLISCTITVNADSEIKFHYLAVPDRPTHINLTHHLYYNLSGESSAMDQELQINAGTIVETRHNYIPTGFIVPLTDDTDYRITRKINGEVDYNDCYVLTRYPPGEPAAILSHRGAGIQMQLSTSCPSIIFYSGHFLNEPFTKRQGICLETQYYPDSPNNRNFPSTLYNEGDTYDEYTTLAFKKLPI